MAALRTAALFEGLGPDELELLAELSRPLSIEDGETLFHMGETATRVYVVGSGIVQLTVPIRVQGSERQITVEDVVPGSTVAWSALVSPHKLTVSGRGSGHVELLGFGRDELMALFAQQPPLGYRVMSNLLRVTRQRLHTVQAMWLRELQRSVSDKYG